MQRWEKQESEISVPRLRNLASLYRRPLAIFFLTSPPNEPPLPEDFRTLPVEGKDGSIEYSKKTLLAIRRATRIQELSVGLREELGHDAPVRIKGINLNVPPEALAGTLREELGITVEEQQKWKDDNMALAKWKNAIEEKGVLVLEQKMDIKEARGFSLFGDGKMPPVIVINYSDALSAKIFSLFHEYAHLVLNESGIQSIHGRQLRFDARVGAIEKFCNRFAAAFLVPKDDLLQERIVRDNLPHKVWGNDVLITLAKMYKVSRETILRRLLTFELTTESFYRQMREEWNNQVPKKTQKGGQRNMSKEAFRENGATFSSLVLEGSSKGKLTYGEAADYLQLKLKYLPKLSEMVRNTLP